MTALFKSLLRPLVHAVRRLLFPQSELIPVLIQQLQILTRQFSELNSLSFDLNAESRLGFHDLFIAVNNPKGSFDATPYRVKTDHPIALKSDDHRFPRGTKNDNTRYPRFVRRCEQLVGPRIAFMDLGCAGGGLVFDFFLRGHRALGLEGSDYSLVNQRAEWRSLPKNLHSADITKPFEILEADTDSVAKFDIISAWEVLEHLPEETLPQFFENVRKHLGVHGLFAASIATFEDRDPITGAKWHLTVKPREWWLNRYREAGLEIANGLFTVRDFPRGSGNGANDWDATLHPELGFHLVARMAR